MHLNRTVKELIWLPYFGTFVLSRFGRCSRPAAKCLDPRRSAWHLSGNLDPIAIVIDR